MLRLLSLCTLIVSLLAPAQVCAQAGADAPTSTCSITGSVNDVETKAGLPSVRLRLVPSVVPDAVSDADGGFQFNAVPPGRYRLIAQLEGFEPFTYPRIITVVSSDQNVAVGYPLRVQASVQTTTEVVAQSAVPENTESTTATALSGQSIVVAPGALEDVLRAFQSKPGVVASQDDRNDMLVRGGGAIENATRIDGFDVPNPSHFGAQGGSGGGFSFIAPWLIDRAVLHTGGFSVAYGERSSSVLDLSLRSPAAEAVGGQAGASIGGAMAEAESSFAGGRGSWLVSARRSFLELVFGRGSDRVVPHYGDAVGKFEFQLTPRNRLEVLALTAVDNAWVDSPDTSNAVRDDQQTTVGGVSLRSQLNGSTVSALYVSYSKARIDAIVNGRGNTDGSDRSTEAETRMRGEVRHSVGHDGQMMAGFTAKQADLRFDLEAKAFRNDYYTYVTALRSHFPYTFWDTSAYTEFRLPSFRGLGFTAGVRDDWAGTTRRSYVSPRFAASYRAGSKVALNASWGVYRQSIPYIWIGSDVRNAAVDPILSRQTVVGVVLRPDVRTTVSVEGFDKNYEGYPVDGNDPWHVLVSAATDYDSPFVGLLTPAGRLKSRGVDTSVTRRFGERLDLGVSYSYWNVRQRALDNVWRRGDYDIRHQLRLDFGYQTRDGRWRAGAQFRLASGRPYTPFDFALSTWRAWGFYDRAQVNAVSYPTYHRLDLRVDRTFTIRRTALVIYGEIENLYNRDNVLLYQWNRANRQTQPVYQWGRLPVAGLRWMF